LLFCAQLYNSNAQDIINGLFNHLVNNYTSNPTFKDYQLQTASFVREIVLIRRGTLEFSNRLSLSRLELDQLVHVVSISQIVTL